MTWPVVIALLIAFTAAVLVTHDQHGHQPTPPQDPPDGDQP